MKSTAASARHAPSPWRDMQRDWEGWSQWERRTVGALTAGSLASAAIWFALSINLIY